MGANQSNNHNSTGPKSIPVRPRTPLRFGSVPTPLPVDPADYNTRPIRNLYPNIAPANSVISLLSQENYLCPTIPLSSTITEEDTPSPASWPSPTQIHCPHSNCAYSVIGSHAPEELNRHLQSNAHYVPHQQMMINSYPQPMQQMPQQSTLIMESEQQCLCPSCNVYQDQWSPIRAPHIPHMDYNYQQYHLNQQQQQYQTYMMHPMLQIQSQIAPMTMSYNGPEVENLNWSGERIPKTMPISSSYPVLKRQRLEFPLNP
ncbi:hypothetical protein BDD12DRAFT_808213 [Trichophaea hybrida]|nr:hypothetical protein BDD12DRAFT_808213 [Trichophaea hybrida]